jgi:nicotinate-nucleotide adenylyltransferase
VLLIPAYRSPFKLAAKGMENSSRDRLDMLTASITGDPRLTVDDCEIRREGVSYTIDTLKDIVRRYMPVGKPGLIIGDDLAADFPKWHNSGGILEIADIIIARRIHSGALSCSFPHIQITNEIMEISSEMVRNRIEGGKAWRYLVPAGAQAIIEDRGLYTCAGTVKESLQSVIFALEQAARKELSPERFIHSRNTALLTWDLCRRFGVDPELGYLAGIAHDLSKPMGDEALLALAGSDGGGISKLEKKKPGLLHGRAAAVLLRTHFGINNRDVLEAVALHTAGGIGMSSLAKIVYIADKVEVTREKTDPALRAMCYEDNDLDRIFFAVLDAAVSSLRSREIDLSEETLRLLEKMKGEKFEKSQS